MNYYRSKNWNVVPFLGFLRHTDDKITTKIAAMVLPLPTALGDVPE
jgi:hypothetical protein